MQHLDLFAGIGGFSLAAALMGWETVAFVEKEPFCHKVLRKNFGDVPIIDDIFNTSYAAIKSILRKRGIRDRRIDIVTGGFPCQPFSQAGKQRGTQDERHLFPQMLRVIQEVKPRYVVAENVRRLLTIENGTVFADIVASLEGEGYSVTTFLIPACAVGAPHRRDRLWIIAENSSRRRFKIERDQERSEIRSFGQSLTGNVERFYPAPHTGRKYGARKSLKGKFAGQIGQRYAAESERSDSGDELRAFTDSASERLQRYSTVSQRKRIRRVTARQNQGITGFASDSVSKRAGQLTETKSARQSESCLEIAGTSADTDAKRQLQPQRIVEDFGRRTGDEDTNTVTDTCGTGFQRRKLKRTPFKRGQSARRAITECIGEPNRKTSSNTDFLGQQKPCVKKPAEFGQANGVGSQNQWTSTDTESAKCKSTGNSRARRFRPANESFDLWSEQWIDVALRTCVRGVDARFSAGLDESFFREIDKYVESEGIERTQKDLEKAYKAARITEKSERVGALKALGNAIVWLIAYEIFCAIEEAEILTEKEK